MGCRAAFHCSVFACPLWETRAASAAMAASKQKQVEIVLWALVVLVIAGYFGYQLDVVVKSYRSPTWTETVVPISVRKVPRMLITPIYGGNISVYSNVQVPVPVVINVGCTACPSRISPLLCPGCQVPLKYRLFNCTDIFPNVTCLLSDMPQFIMDLNYDFTATFVEGTAMMFQLTADPAVNLAQVFFLSEGETGFDAVLSYGADATLVPFGQSASIRLRTLEQNYLIAAEYPLYRYTTNTTYEPTFIGVGPLNPRSQMPPNTLQLTTIMASQDVTVQTQVVSNDVLYLAGVTGGAVSLANGLRKVVLSLLKRFVFKNAEQQKREAATELQSSLLST